MRGRELDWLHRIRIRKLNAHKQQQCLVHGAWRSICRMCPNDEGYLSCRPDMTCKCEDWIPPEHRNPVLLDEDYLLTTEEAGEDTTDEDEVREHERVDRRRVKERQQTFTRRQIEEYILHNRLDLKAAETLRAADQRAVDDMLSQGKMNNP